jgi:hypothetical protein
MPTLIDPGNALCGITTRDMTAQLSRAGRYTIRSSFAARWTPRYAASSRRVSAAVSF